MKKKKIVASSLNNSVIYQTKSGALELRGDIHKETVWATLNQISQLFDTDKSGISRHIRNIYESGELIEKATVAKIATVQKEGGRDVERIIEYYNMDMILSVGYRINSKTTTLFRQWATRTLREYLVKGYTLNKKVILKNYDQFIKNVSEIQSLLPTHTVLDPDSKRYLFV
jgi:hypothetical protein